MHGATIKIKVLKPLCCYSSHEVSLCGGRIYTMYVDAAVVLARYVLSLSV